MKKSLYLLALIFSINLTPATATVWRVNNSLPENITGGLFTTLQRAHDHFDLRNGDTLMVEGSSIPYDGFTFTKRLVVIGPGYFLGENAGVNGIVTSASVSRYSTFKPGSEGSYFIGMQSTSTLEIDASNLYVIRCNIESIYYRSRASNCKISMSKIDQITSTSFEPGSGISVTNSILGYENSALSYTTFENNILVSKNYTWKISAGTFRNNVLIERDAKVEISSPNSQNNFAPNAQFGTTNGNRAYEPADLFVGGTSSDGKYRLKATSPYLTAGFGGTQPGLFGGSEPYALSGIPPVPIIYELNVPGTGSPASGLSINVKIRGAN